MKNSKENYNSTIIKLVGAKAVAFNPILARIGGSATAGLFLGQLFYWWDKGEKKEWIYKTIWEVEEETALIRSEQERAIKVWKALGVLETKLEGSPPVRHFHINETKFIRLLEIATGMKILKSANQFADFDKLNCRFDQITITENTPESSNRNSVVQTAASMQNLDAEQNKDD